MKYYSMKKILGTSLLIFIFFLPGLSQKSNKLKMQDMYNAIKDAGIEQPDFVMAQSIKETGWLNCKRCCLRYHNLFGFYKSENKCMRFDSDKECLNYYKKWQGKHYPKWKKKHLKGTYYDFLKYSKYATSKTYNQELKGFVAWVRKNLKL